MAFFTLDIVNRRYPVIGQATGLPCDCLSVLACPSTGGVMVVASNSIIYVDQSGRKVVLPVNGWVPRISDIALPTNLTPEEQARTLELEGSRSIFVDDKTAFIILKDGTTVRVRIEATLAVEDVVRQLCISVKIKDPPSCYALRDENEELVTNENLKKKIKQKVNLK